jgi:p-cumate 2,3-dioxygenase beta subunit
MSSADLPSRQEVEDLLYREADLLDRWRLDEWLALLTDDATYQVPPTDTPGGDARNTLFLVADDASRIRARVKQLMGKSAWSESPPSRTRRLLSNVRVLGGEGDNIHVAANFVVYRFRHELVDTYIGHYEYELVRHEGDLKIRKRKAILDIEALRPQGKISFIL